MLQISLRLEEERKRLGFNQDQMAALGGVAKRTYCNYEAGISAPSAVMLEAIAKMGVDIQYIVTGTHSQSALAADELLLLNEFRAMDEKTRKRMLAFALGGETSKFVVHGSVGQNVETASNFTIDMRKGHK
ncbi:helix-turn-helix domain-containing protein [Iodobacter sp. BJB302]|uniref:helix-turn-helix domain-containing protein n=1 Tax=Iodobacter sp. BJB302 TaxID=1506510 RepID=UPI0015D4C0D3|nr:helix-turn-helix transcriptional regulator [Iodobacter sp. BJB302]